MNRCKDQKRFTRLDINIRDIQYVAKTSYFSLVSHGAGHILRTDEQNKHTSIDAQTLIKYIRILYPNLLHISADIYFRITRHLQITEWTSLFANLVTIKMTLPSIENVKSFLQQIKQSSSFGGHGARAFDNLKNLTIYGIHPCSSECIEDGKRYDYINEDIIKFIDEICQFIRYRPSKLNTFEILMHHFTETKYKDLKKTYWSVYYKLLLFILKLIEEDNGKYIMDGSIRLDLPYLDFWVKQKPDHRWYYGDYIWTKENENESLKIAQIVTNIQLAMKKYNESLEFDDINKYKKTIVHLGSLVLRNCHHKFLKFWFNDDTLYNNAIGKKFVF